MKNPLEFKHPYPLESEEAIVGVLLRNSGDCLHDIRVELDPEDFFNPSCRETYKALCDMDTEQIPIDMVSVCDHLEAMGSKVSPVELGKMIDTPAVLASLSYHVEQVKSYSNARRVHAFGLKWAKEAAADPTRQLVSELLTDSLSLLDGRSGAKGLEALKGAHEEWLTGDSVGEAALTTGIESLDKMVKCEADHLWLVAGRPKTGKTSFVIDAFTRFGGTKQGSGLFFSLEMSAVRLLRKLNARICPHADFRNRMEMEEGFLTQYDLMAEYADKTYGMPLKIVDSVYDVEDIVATVRAEKRRNPELSYIAIDYVEMISTKKRVNGPVETINEVCKQLVRLKAEVQCPIFLIAQLRRKGQDSGDIPDMGDLKGSSYLEQSADVMLLLWSDGLSDAEYRLVGETYKKIKAKVIQRDGGEGILNLRYYPPQALFGDWRY